MLNEDGTREKFHAEKDEVGVRCMHQEKEENNYFSLGM